MAAEKVLSLAEIGDIIDKHNLPCTCGATIQGSNIDCYGPHDGGIKVKGYADKQWVYVNCPKCGYDWALWKLLNKIKPPEDAPETEKWNGSSIRKEDKGSISNIRCAHPTCKTHPLLRWIYWVDDNIPIGQVCIKKGAWGTLDSFLGRTM